MVESELLGVPKMSQTLFSLVSESQEQNMWGLYWKCVDMRQMLCECCQHGLQHLFESQGNSNHSIVEMFLFFTISFSQLCVFICFQAGAG